MRDIRRVRLAGAFAVGLVVLPLSLGIAKVVIPKETLEFAEVGWFVVVLPIGTLVGGILAALVAGRGRGIAGWLAMLAGLAAYLGLWWTLVASIHSDLGLLGDAVVLYAVPVSVGFGIGAIAMWAMDRGHGKNEPEIHRP